MRFGVLDRGGEHGVEIVQPQCETASSRSSANNSACASEPFPTSSVLVFEYVKDARGHFVIVVSLVAGLRVGVGWGRMWP